VEAYLIDKELTRIWDSLQGPNKGANKLRACLFNLILYTQKNERAEYIRTLTQKVVERFPSRVISVLVDKTATEDSLDAKVSVMTGAKGEFDVVCDLIELQATKKSEKRIPFVLLPYILPDLPVYLLWAENPTLENPLSHELETFTTRMIFDSETTDNLPLFAKALLQHKEEAKCDIADLNWARTENWRELLSSTFYSEERLQQLKTTKTIQIKYNSCETKFFCHTKTQAVYLQGWLASQLGWKLTEVKGDHFFYGPISIQLESTQNPHLSPGTVVSLDLSTNKGETFSFSRNPHHPHQISMIFCDSEKCAIPSKYIFTKSQTGLSLVNEIGHVGTSDHYLKLLNYLVELEGK
jgi:glucose-6-phosphate dehydrogenase assembly protein OpcA